MNQGTLLFAGLVVIASGMPAARADVPIALVPGARQIVLDFDWDTQNHFAVVRGAGPQFEVWTLYTSTNQGASWTNPGGFTTTDSWADVDLAVAGDYVYVGFHSLDDPLVRIARFFATDGSWDSVYGARTFLDVSPSTVVDIALASDQDGPDNEIYYAVIASDGSLRFFFDSSADGTTFAELSPGITDAVSGLDMTYNPGSPDHLILFSYWDDSYPHLHIWRTFPWEEARSIPVPNAITRASAISAYDNAVVVCYGKEYANGPGIGATTSWNAGDGWLAHLIDIPGPGEGDYGGCDVTARAGGEFAITYMHEEGDFDPVYLRRQTRQTSFIWSERLVINETDVAMASIFRTNLTWFPPGHYGIAYLENSQGYPYFDSFPLLILLDGFESGDTSAWSQVVP
jgi:hypothetical protein